MAFRLGVPGLALLLSLGCNLGGDAQPAGRVDLYGDPLPPGAVARLGTVRLRHAHSYGSLSTAISPDGEVIATCGDQDIRLWDAKTGKLLRKLEKYHFTRLQFTPDGRHIAASCYEPPEMRLTEVATGRVTQRFPTDVTDVWVVAFSRDGKRVVLGESAKPAAVWDVATGNCLVVLDGNDRQFASVIFSHDDKLVLSTTYDGNLCQWDAQTGKLRKQTALPTLRARMRAFSHDGRTLAIAPYNSESVQLLDTDTMKERLRLQGEPSSCRHGMAFSHDDKVLATNWNEPWADEMLISFWDVATGKKLREFKLPSRLAENFKFMPDGQSLMTFSGPGVQLWDARTGKPRHDWAAHQREVNALTFTPDSKRLISGSGSEIRVWDTATSKSTHRLAGNRWNVSGLAVFPDGQRFASAGGDGSIRLFDLARGKETGRILLGAPPEEQPKPEKSIGGFALSRDGRHAVTVALGRVQRWDLESGKELSNRPVASVGELRSFNPELQTMIIETNSGTLVEQVDPARTLLAITAEGTNGGANRFTPDGRAFLTTNHSGLAPVVDSNPMAKVAYVPRTRQELQPTIQLWEVASGRARLRFTKGLEGYAFLGRLEVSSDARRLAVYQDGSMRLFDLTTGIQLWRRDGLDASIRCLAFSPDGRTLATSHADSTILIWDVSSSIAQVPAPPADVKQLDAWWQALADADAKKAHQAIWALIDRPEQAGPLLKQRLTPVPKLDVERVKGLVKKLDSDRFAEREQAMKDLAGLEEQAEPTLRAALKETSSPSSPEQKRRLETLLARPSVVTHAETLRRIRAVEVLEHIGTPPAHEVLKALAVGEGSSRATQEAKAALGRLPRR